MPPPQVSATLKYGGQPAPAGATVPVDASGLEVELQVPPGVALVSASLTLKAPADSETLDVLQGSPPAAIVTSTGKASLPDTTVEWFTVDWGVRRPLVSLKLVPTGTTGTGKGGRLRLTEGGPWFLPTPAVVVPLGSSRTLPALMASRLMLEVITLATAQNPNEAPATADITGLELKAAARPVDLRAAVGTESPFFIQALPLQPLQELTLRDELLAALTRAWPASLEGGRVVVTLRSSAPGRLLRPRLSLFTAPVLTTFEGGQAVASRILPTDGQAEAAIPVPAGRTLQGVELTVEPRLRPERSGLLPRPPDAPPLAHHCGQHHAAAQGFSPLPPGADLQGIDLFLRLLSRAATGTLAIHPDDHGQPAVAPFPGATVDLALEELGTPPGPSRWVSFELPKVLATGEGGWWAVLTLTAGELLWSLGDAAQLEPSAEVLPQSAAFRLDSNPWLAREVPGLTRPWAYSRPRLADPAPRPPPRVQLRWGTAGIDVPLDGEGHASLGPKQLEALPPPVAGTGAQPPLRVVLGSTIAGDVTLRQLRVTLSADKALLSGLDP
ncbi:hypothetical protein [Vitiosangium sp. GDMCC 1.1324]|uniref:hypothetical protein n=1 Tax=Vitiosangium sp. (strain GDMCC 1.1324) TaxID=2138576 RepID=UPI000D36A333|nr:hypothetical protein [Vitiosangium sp. GDMCC 1.1324]PTL80171.1 hypothetical protein DAT35_29610 [Vitiosangium sp. GDMCC 1.1324]